MRFVLSRFQQNRKQFEVARHCDDAAGVFAECCVTFQYSRSKSRRGVMRQCNVGSAKRRLVGFGKRCENMDQLRVRSAVVAPTGGANRSNANVWSARFESFEEN